jgi:adenine-specific DNA-methyltransferase
LTELIWDGKYKDAKKPGPVRIELPFQTVETVNETAQERQLTLDRLFSGQETEWRNRLIWGDKKYVLPSLLPEFVGKVNLIYIDPPFATGDDFSFSTEIPESDDDFIKRPSIVEQKAYRDTWSKGLESYLQWFYETVILLRELLSEEGSIYVHLDWHVGHYAKALLDEVFGQDNFLNEVIWVRSAPRSNVKRGLPAGHDTIFIYTRSAASVWNRPLSSLSDEYTKSHYSNVEPGTGRLYRLDNMISPNPDRPNLKYEWNGVTRVWRVTKENMQRLHDAGRIVYTSQGVAAYKRYLDESQGTPLTTVWQDIPPVNSQAIERVRYRTQKPEALLERIIKASSNEDDIILDCFCGSGTTAAVAEKLGRRWIACDLGRFAIHTTRKRLLSIDNVKPFVVQNLGKYERQAWQAAEFSDPTQRASVQLRYRNFILQLYHATPIDGYTWLHGIKRGRLVHVGSVDAPIALGEVKAIVNEFWRVRGKDVGEHSNSIDILGWDFAFDLNETAKQMAADAYIRLAFKKIPREVLEKKAVELKNFFVPPDDVPEDVRNAITHWSQWIDYWAVDWDYRDDAFHNQWQTYRKKKEPNILLQAFHEYDEPGSYIIVMKVIDILGNDTTKAVAVNIH